MSKIFLLLILTSLLACNKNKESPKMTKTQLLTSSKWIKDYYEDSIFINGSFEKVTKDETNKGVEYLEFESNLVVTYNHPSVTYKILGNWNFKMNESVLVTNLTLELPPSSGYSTKYFFREGKIVELNGNSLILEAGPWDSFDLQGNVFTKINKFYFKH